MKKTYLFNGLLITIIMLQACISFAQKSTLKFDTSDCKSYNDISEVEVIDKRSDKGLGFIQTGPLNAKQTLHTNAPLDEELKSFYKTLAKNNTPNKKLVIILYNFFAYEQTGVVSEAAYFMYAADYFLTENNQNYRLLKSIDTTIVISAMDVTKKLLRTIDKSLCEFSPEQLSSLHNTDTYTYEELLQYEDVLKKSYPSYTVTKFPVGIYKTWKDFLQLHVKDSVVLVKKGDRFFQERRNRRGKARLYPIVHAKVISYNGTLFYKADDRFYPLTKKNNDFYFIGKSSQFTNTAAVAAAGAAFGIIGAAIASTEATDTYLFRLNYKKGKLLPIKKITKDLKDKDIDDLLNE